MKMMSLLKNNWKRIVAILFALLLTIVSVFLTLTDESEDKIVGTIISIVGSAASIYAIFETFVKIKTVSQEQDKIRKEILDKVSFLDKRETMESIAQHLEICTSGINMLRVDNIEASLIHIDKLNQFILELMSVPALNLSSDMELKKYSSRMVADLSALRNINPKLGIDSYARGNMIERFTELQQYLGKLKNKLKYMEHEK